MLLENDLKALLEGRKILVTGGTGSIGQEIVKTVLKYDPAVVRILSNSENELFELQQQLKRVKEKTRYLIGDIRSKNRLKKAMKDIDFVFHAAALKHVPLCEYNPLEAVKTNVLGTSNVIETAWKEGVQKLVNISTDKATAPVNVMGACKLLGERITSSWATISPGTTLYSVRFGNVLGSRGSILPIIEEHLLKGQSIPITDDAMTRFIMTISDAVKLVIKTLLYARGGEIFVLKMPRVRIREFIEAAIEFFCDIHDLDPDRVDIQTIGIRPGEKLSESLLTQEELTFSYETEDLILVPSVEKIYDPLLQDYQIHPDLNAKPISRESYDSGDGPFLSKKEILAYLRKMAP